MKLKRILASAFAVAAVVAAMGTPMTYADSNDSQAPVTEIGTFTVDFWGPALAFTPASVSSTQSQDVVLDWPATGKHRVLMINDNMSYNPNGYVVSIDATNLQVPTLPQYFIDKSNLSVKNVGGGPHSSCLYPYAPYNTVVGGNAYQTVTIATIGDYTSLSSTIEVVRATAGRGCKEFQINLDFKLHVPAGTYTGGGTATYKGTVTVTSAIPA
ncbi:MAG: hypothetical protein IT334_01155 [Thermomicrobiales bacterium]|nr:hypothetical protein [Thermomicrobiales bacterium]